MALCRDELTVTPRRIADQFIVVATADDRTVGFAALFLLTGRAAELSDLFVEPDFIGRGAGRRLLAAIRDVARMAGARLLIVDSDPNAKEFYLRHGFAYLCEVKSRSIPGRKLPRLSRKL